MKEMAEFRIPERKAMRYLPAGIGERLGDTIRKVVVSTDDPLFTEIGRLENEFKSKGESFFLGNELRRQYSRNELNAAELFHIWPKRVFEPAGEECGTVYNDTVACPKCGSGAAQVSVLRLDLRKVPKSVDFAESIASEQIVSQRLAEAMIDGGLSGFSLRPVMHKAFHDDDSIDLRKLQSGRELLRDAMKAGVPHPTWGFYVWLNRKANRARFDKIWQEGTTPSVRASTRQKILPSWYQLVVTSTPVDVTPPTRFGEDVFDWNAYGRCPRGDLAGLNFLSEVTLRRGNRGGDDILASKQYVGVRRGLLRPRRLLLVSHKAWQVISHAEVKGVAVEVAHLS